MKKKLTDEERERKIKTDAENTVRTMFRVVLKSIGVIFNILMTLVLVLIVAGFIVVCAFAVYLANNVEDTDVSDLVTVGTDTNSITSIYYYDENGNIVEDSSQRLSSGKNIMWVQYADIPDNLKNAFVAIEDKRFYDHNGVDWITTIRSTLKYFIPMGYQSGGSTITQQLVKNVTGDDDYSIQRKVTEIMRALSLERSKSKEEIMENYLNIIYLSQGAYGVQAAANVYFSKDVSELNLLECTAIAGITQSPTKWDPVQNPENNKKRRNIILGQMLEQGFITQAEYQEAYDADLTLNTNYESISLGTTSWFNDVVINDTIELFKKHYNVNDIIAKQMVYSGGYKIITSYSPKVQSVVDKYYKDVSKDSVIPVKEVIMPESAMIVADPYTGNILALAGGRGEKTESRIFNRATMAKRQPGSSMKPIGVYCQAIDLGIIHAGSPVDDVPYDFGTVTVNSKGQKTFSKPNGWPKNTNNKYMGLLTLEYAISASKNTTAVNTLAKIGVDRSYEFLTKKLHFNSILEAAEKNGGVSPDKHLASLSLGGFTYGVTLREMVSAYTIFPTGGLYTPLRTVIEIRDFNDNVIINNTVEKEIAISEETAQVMSNLMRHVILNSEGTAYNRMKEVKGIYDVAGKTGTSDINKDRWFIGFSPYYICGDWIGYDEPQALTLLKNGEHCRIWSVVMGDLHEEFLQRQKDGIEPLKTLNDNLLIKATYCRDSGKLLTDACRADPRGSRSETAYFAKSTLPTQACDVHVLVPYCTQGHGIACSNCPSGSVKYVGLMNFTRKFIKDVYVTDSEYTYKKLPSGTKPYTASKFAYYYYTYAADTYPGRTSGKSYQYNRGCPLHN